MSYDVDAQIYSLPVEEARRLLDGQIAAVQEQLSRLKRQRNSLAPISRLPTEVLCKIFACLRFTPSLEYDYTRVHEWIYVTHVCREWRDVCFGYQDLWSELRTDTLPYQWLGIMAERSRGAPLSIQWHLSSQSKSRADLLHKILQSPSTALKEVDLDGEPSALTEALKQIPAAPSLLSLKVWNDGGRTPRWDNDPSTKIPVVLPEHFLNGEAPALRSIDFYQCFLPWTSGLLQGLTSLRLRLPPLVSEAYHPPTSTQLLDALSRMPQLENLELNLELSDMSGDGTGDTVMLYSLSSLKLAGICGHIAGLLSRLRIPASCQVHLQCAQATTQSLDALAAALQKAWHASPIPPTPTPFPNASGDLFHGIIIGNNGYEEGLKFACYKRRPLLPNKPKVPNPIACEFNLRLPDQEGSFRDSWWQHSPLPSKACSRMLRTLPLEGVQEATIDHWLSKEEMGEVLVTLSAVKGLNLEEFGAPKVIQLLLDNATLINAPSSSSSSAANSKAIFLPNLEWLQLNCVNIDSRSNSSQYAVISRELHPVSLSCVIEMLKIRANLGKKVETLEFVDCHGLFKADVEKLKTLDIAGAVVWDEKEIQMDSVFDSDEDMDDDLHYGIDYELDAEYGQWGGDSDIDVDDYDGDGVDYA
ncbi:hypothetical protein BKA70DRAFT_1264779 [Coprinopsis sp. MPI-PUGE-AT-0042]|nr:hypothetical protein BKA70DRAFT_1264779 [Coprinopsis sp. MPI-PUGE-AT-0042]